MQINQGRFPANLIHDGSDEVKELFPQSNGAAAPVAKGQKEFGGVIYGKFKSGGDDGASFYNDSGSAARFFYCAKASKQDRDEGCESMPAVKSGMSNGAQLHGEGYDKGQDIGLNRVIQRRNHHPTVKPTALMRYLVKLVSRPGHTILDPFSGSGSTGKAAILEARQFLGIELQPEYVQIATARLSHAVKLHQESSAQHSAVTHH
jgi:site-specific DNA-methyltransferase (adenine-specific)